MIFSRCFCLDDIVDYYTYVKFYVGLLKVVAMNLFRKVVVVEILSLIGVYMYYQKIHNNFDYRQKLHDANSEVLERKKKIITKLFFDFLLQFLTKSIIIFSLYTFRFWEFNCSKFFIVNHSFCP